MPIHIDTERWPLKTPFRIAGYAFSESDVIVVTVREDGISGRAEGMPVDGGNDPLTQEVAREA